MVKNCLNWSIFTEVIVKNKPGGLFFFGPDGIAYRTGCNARRCDMLCLCNEVPAMNNLLQGSINDYGEFAHVN